MFIAVGKSRFDKHWKNQDISWSSFLDKLKETYRTRETMDEFKKMPSEKRGNIKDVGGFIGGKLKDGRHSKSTILSRSMITLDMDYAPINFWDVYTMFTPYTSCLYSTHSYTDKTPRFRLIVPLSREVTPEEYEAIARKFTEEVGIDYFDDSTYQPSRLMYWPSTSKDGPYIFEHQEGDLLDADRYLLKYDDWRDISFWPTSSKGSGINKNSRDKLEDPTTKKGSVGLFCRTYSITDAIATFLSDVYEPCASPNRYTYTKGSTAGGLVVYDDLWAYSNHSTDPCSMRNCNAFDLVRIHLFGDRDENAKPNTPANKMPSYVEMSALVRNDEECNKVETVETWQERNNTTEPMPEEEKEWTAKLAKDTRTGAYLSSIDNIVTILENHSQLKGNLGGVDLFANKVIKSGSLPWWSYDPYDANWTDDDDANMRHFLEKQYGIVGAGKIMDAQRIVHRRNAFNPLKDYLNACVWDGVERLDTLFIDYLGVEDSEYARMATRKAFTAAVKRVYEPGCKFDYMVVLYGPQGVGKSQILTRMGMRWFTDNLKSFKGKEAQEVIQGQWIIELSELSALKRSEVEESKQFVSMQVDRYRKPYERNTTDNPRTCVFFGTTNRQEFLKDNTGNRRYWPLDVRKEQATKNIWNDLTEMEIQKLWAEARMRYEQKEPMWLGEELEKIALDQQEEHRETDPRKEDVMEYLETPIPDNWHELDLLQRREYLEGNMPEIKGTHLRDRVCANEVINECLYKFGAKLGNVYDVKDVNDIIREIPGWEYKRSIRFKGESIPRKGFIRAR